jgi:hypothetical protein
MTTEKQEPEIRQYAEGWITERTGTEVPGFLKLAFPVIALFCIAYLFVYLKGETSHGDRGFLVQKLNEATQTSDPLMWFVGGLAIAFGITVVMFALRKSH